MPTRQLTKITTRLLALTILSSAAGCGAAEPPAPQTPAAKAPAGSPATAVPGFTSHLMDYHALTKQFHEPRRLINELLAIMPDSDRDFGKLIQLDRGCAAVPGNIAFLKGMLSLMEKGALQADPDAITCYVSALPVVMELTADMKLRFGTLGPGDHEGLLKPASLMYRTSTEIESLLHRDLAEKLSLLSMTKDDFLPRLGSAPATSSLYASPLLTSLRGRMPADLASALTTISEKNGELRRQFEVLRKDADRLRKKKGGSAYLMIPEALTSVEYTVNGCMGLAALAGLADAAHAADARNYAREVVGAGIMTLDRVESGFASEQFVAMVPGLEEQLESAMVQIEAMTDHLESLRKALAQ